MAGEVAALAAEVAPFVTAYGAAVLEKTKNDLADETVGLGKRLLNLIFRREKDDKQLPDIVAEAVETPGDSVVRGMLEYTIRKALENDARMLAEVREILAETAPRAKITQHVRAGRNAYVVGQGDMNVIRSTDLAKSVLWLLNLRARTNDLRAQTRDSIGRSPANIRYGAGRPGRSSRSWHAWRTGRPARLAAARM
jgi:hypothetical protein